jgi:hypothetical protein
MEHPRSTKRTVTLPEPMIERINQMAASELRSFNNMVYVLLTEALEHRGEEWGDAT